jgi:ATP-dependent DNA ligase
VQWIYETKHDGFRFICRRDGERIFSRRGNDWTDWVPVIAEPMAALRIKSVTTGGEGVVCSPDAVSDFDRLGSASGPYLFAWLVRHFESSSFRRYCSIETIMGDRNQR